MGICEMWNAARSKVAKRSSMPESYAEAILEACSIVGAPNPAAMIVHPPPELPGTLWSLTFRCMVTESEGNTPDKLPDMLCKTCYASHAAMQCCRRSSCHDARAHQRA